MKECSCCKQLLDLTEFTFKNKQKGTLQAQCNVCRKQTAKKSYQKNRAGVIAKTRQRGAELREWYKVIKSKMSCCVCGENDPSCLDFHHIDPTEKEHDPSISLSFGKESFLMEISRCACLCANCHRKEHAGRLNAPLVKLEITQLCEG